MDSEDGGKRSELIESEPIPELPTGGGTLVQAGMARQYESFKGAGEGAVTPDEGTTLTEPFADDDHEIKPTGEVFVSQVHVRRRLNQVFRPGGWAMVPMSTVRQKPGLYGRVMFFQEWHLVAQGRFLASAWGEQEYQPKNENTTEATALEGVKSNALVRCAKDLSIASECWDKQWTEKWKEKYAESVWCKNVAKGSPQEGKSKLFWRRKDAKHFTYPWVEKSDGGQDK